MSPIAPVHGSTFGNDRQRKSMTEAACLLQSGALYRFRVGFRPNEGDDIFLGIKPGAFSVYFGDAPYFHFDLEGRWQRALIEGTHFLKSFDGTVHSLDRVRRGENLILERKQLSFADASNLDDRIRRMAIDLLDDSRSRLTSVPAPDGTPTLSDDQIADLLGRISHWDHAAWFSHREKYLYHYGILPFLPPETANPIILQASLGDATGRQFGGASGTSHYLRSFDEFKVHVQSVAKLLGRRVLQARQVFLAGPDVLLQPTELIIKWLDAIAAVFPISADRLRLRARDVDVYSETPSLEGVHALIYEFDKRPPFTADEWTTLRDKHLSRVILGIETGSAKLLKTLGRRWTNTDLAAWVDSLPEATGVVIPVGIGGKEDATSHVEETVALVRTLSLKPNSLISLVDVEDLETECPRVGTKPLGTPLTAAELSAQRAELKSRLAEAVSDRKIKVTTYSAEKRWQ